ncbi:hypothetical protein GJT89_02230 (plasmid) [Enterobacteriaceae endosymbiont of Donacia versicolorea]|uniref:glycoside hydrolase family 28 protein n=1 Tax=Enterobacteriaceae endosymbiont of Donacia versicolorea TaxID=2675788 RepID=UPI001448B5DD|nr:glycosyl hydrolase family 28 protein [Enterobacteriaceae endosymbiont of Donacia versicolorea]QJC32295.1 hypothetical protein GJT89_02230 [Enterobacteriaceae endosymbiont of Donacia versicolorea]
MLNNYELNKMKILFYKKIQNIFFKVIFIITITILSVKNFVYAKDKRSVTEPIVPKICKILIANDQSRTTDIQEAILYCAKKHEIVSLISSNKGNNNFFSGPIIIPSYGGLYIDKKVILSAINDPNLYDKGNKTCGLLDNLGNGCKPFITLNGENSGLYGFGYIDGQGGILLKNKKYTWWQLATNAKLHKKKQNIPHLIDINSGYNITIYKLNLINSPNFHIVSHKTNGLTIWGININTPNDARNTDGIDPSSSQNITITHTNISTGDDNIAIKSGGNEGISSKNITIINNNFSYGHGMSIGSETINGVNDILIKNLSLTNTTNGIRIKSNLIKGGLVTDINYENICMINVKNPIVLKTNYVNIIKNNKEPQFKNIFFKNIKILTPGTLTFDGLDEKNIIEVFFNDFHIKEGSLWIKNNVIIHGNIDNIINEKNCLLY